jgi:hypothetical protein
MLSKFWTDNFRKFFQPRVHKFSKNLGATSKFYVPERWCEASFILRGPQMLGAIIQNLVARVTFHPGFVRACFQQWYSHWASCVKLQEKCFRGNSGIAGTCCYCWEKILSTDFLITPKIAIILRTSYMWYMQLKVKCIFVQALRLCTGCTTHRGSRGIALLFHDHVTRRGRGVSVMPRPLFTPGKDAVPIVQEAGWAPGPVWTSAKNLTPTGNQSLDRPARSQSLYWLSYPAYNISW